MGAESRESYAPAIAQLNELASNGRPLHGVADELLGVSAVLAGEPRLRRALADPSRTGDERAGLIASVVEGKVSADTANLLRTLTSGRWSSGYELVNAVERLGVEALLANAQANGELAEVEDELFRFGQVVDSDLRLASAIGATSAPAEQRAQLAASLLQGKARSATVRLVTVAVRGFGGRRFAGSLARLVELAARRRERQIAYVTVAAALSSAESSRLATRLTQLYGRAVEIKVTVNPEVLGGASVRVGDDLYDGTVRHRLNETRSALVSRR